MAPSGSGSGSPPTSNLGSDSPPEAAIMRRRLKRLVDAIADASASAPRAEDYDEAARTLSALRQADLGCGVGKLGSPVRRGEGSSGRSMSSPDSPAAEWRKAAEALPVPEHFRCPISSEIMRDPVVVASGQTYDRRFIERWLNAGNRTCPHTQQVLCNTTLIPNHLVWRMISEWCNEHKMEIPLRGNTANGDDENLVTNDDRATVNSLLEKISSPSSTADQKKAIRDLRLLTKQSNSSRVVVLEIPGSIPLLISASSLPELRDDPSVLEDIVTVMLNLSIHDGNKKIIGDEREAIPFLVGALSPSGTMETRRNAAAALFSLSALDSNKAKIGLLGAMKPLVDLLERGSVAAKKDAASALFNLCILSENRSRIVVLGIVAVLLNAVEEKSMVSESVAILALLSGDPGAVDEISLVGGTALMLQVIRDSPSKHDKENASVVLHAICVHDRSARREVSEDEAAHGSLAWLAQNGTSRARRKAEGILERLKRVTPSPSRHVSC